ncbi:MAG: hypothetical protein HYS12_19215 [Planctomycetes bacterium]|nr:hypothetical protein [Planctomycetota bacterium]
MSRHRFRGLLDDRPIPSPSSAIPSVSGFMVCPLAMTQGMMGQMSMWQQAYQLAFEQARAVLRPSPLDRFVASLN